MTKYVCADQQSVRVVNTVCRYVSKIAAEIASSISGHYADADAVPDAQVEVSVSVDEHEQVASAQAEQARW